VLFAHPRAGELQHAEGRVVELNQASDAQDVDGRRQPRAGRGRPPRQLDEVRLEQLATVDLGLNQQDVRCGRRRLRPGAAE
jgi:hypothetical protein